MITPTKVCALILVFELWFLNFANTMPIFNNLLFDNNLAFLYKLKNWYPNKPGIIFRKKRGKFLHLV